MFVSKLPKIPLFNSIETEVFPNPEASLSVFYPQLSDVAITQVHPQPSRNYKYLLSKEEIRKINILRLCKRIDINECLEISKAFF